MKLDETVRSILLLISLLSFSYCFEDKGIEETLEWLKHKVLEQESEIKLLKQKPENQTLNHDVKQTFAEPRTCEDIRLLDPTQESGFFWIDPDGFGVGDPPIKVYCNLKTGTTEILHDSEHTFNVSHCSKPGCYSRNVKYNATIRQLAALTEISRECRQKIRYNCLLSPLFEAGSQNGWWKDRNGAPQYYWAGEGPSHTCQCGMSSNCILKGYTCNCDTNAPEAQVDEGYITRKTALPVTSLHFGPNKFSSSFARHTLGRLECFGKLPLASIPTSCKDLWRAGVLTSGFHTVVTGRQLRMVFCDMNKLPSESGMEREIGEPMVKTRAVYFYATEATVSGSSRIIKFNRVMTNFGGSFHGHIGAFIAPVAGVYMFSFNGHTKNTNIEQMASIRKNGHVIAIADHNVKKTWISVAANAIVDLNVGDKIEVFLEHTAEVFSRFGYSQFTGALLQQHVRFN